MDGSRDSKVPMVRSGAFKRRSIFEKVLIPTILVMLLQTLMVGSVLFVNGTVKSVQDSAMTTLKKNAENRGITLENLMVHSPSNLDKVALDAVTVIDRYLQENSLSPEEALGSHTCMTDILYEVSDSMITALRSSASTGVFLYFVDAEADAHGEFHARGLYYRDLDPVLTPADNSDILFLRGFVDIARKDKIQLDSLWREDFIFSPENTARWDSFATPLRAARENPDISPADLSYWSLPYRISTELSSDSNECITYTRPLFYNGRPIAMFGIEMQTAQLKKHFPESDFGSSGQGGYMLARYTGGAGSPEETAFSCEIFAVTGSYIKRMLGADGELTLAATSDKSVYTVENEGVEPSHVALVPMRLYNANTPFYGQRWYLVSMGLDDMLFGTMHSVITGIFSAAILAILVGSVLLAVTIRVSTKPLISIAEQIETNGPADPIVIAKQGTYETELLCSTINEMKSRRRAIETALREERERYLFALESVTDTFLEYDTASDRFISYHFSDTGHRNEPLTHVIHSFLQEVRGGGLTHPEDGGALIEFMKGGRGDHIEIRVLAAMLPFSGGASLDSGYRWVSVKTTRIYDDEGNIAKIIGVARNITEEKIREHALLEASRNDATTRLSNKEYGLNLLNAGVSAARADGERYAVCLLRVDAFNSFEVRYGRVFGGVILMRLGALLAETAGSGFGVRLSNDEFILFFPGLDRAETEARLAALSARLGEIYTGEDGDLSLSLSVGVALSADAAEASGPLPLAARALQYAVRGGRGRTAFYGDLPPEARDAPAALRLSPVSVSLEISKENIVGFVFDLFEHTPNIHSVLYALLGILGETFSLDQILLCSYDVDFGANQVTCQWNSGALAPYPAAIEKVSAEEFSHFAQLLDGNGTLRYTAAVLEAERAGLRRILCAPHGEAACGFCCAMYENSAHVGRMLFKTADADRVWEEADLYSLYEVAKIISAHISIEKSNSASKAKSDFLSRMSHEIRTPMNAIIGLTRISRENVGDPDRLAGYLEKIDFSAKHLLALINDVLDMSRIESGKLQLSTGQCSLRDFVASIDALMRPVIEDRRLRFEIVTRLTHFDVECDEHRLRQVLVNLLGNAAKFTEAGGLVVFALEESGGAREGEGNFRFSVRDTGVGIRKEDQPSIFKAFEQAKEGDSAKKRNEGTGLGLAISSSIIAAMGSSIQLESAEGRGSEFFFTLTLKLGSGDLAAAAPEVGEQDYATCFVGKTVLLAEDNEINLEIMTYILNEVGFKTDLARNGEEAVSCFFRSPPGYYDVILMDIQMPVMDGLTATREIRKRGGERADARTTPIIAMTANAFDEDTRKSIESGMNGHMAKPVDHLKLYAMLRRLLCE